MAGDWRERLKNIAGAEVFFGEPMALYTSIGVGGRADALVCPDSVEALGTVIAALKEHGVPYEAVGNCTNLIVRDGGYRGAVIVLKNLKALKVVAREGKEAVISAGAGVPLPALVALSVGESLTGMEFCAGIPGSVGGAVKMNAGAYGSEMKDVIASVSVMNGDGRTRSFERKDLRFEYRNLALPGRMLVLGALFRLSQGDPVRIKERVAEIMRTRWSRHPMQHKNAGSIFKNPPGMPAGKLIDEAGLKGLRVGDAEVSDMHGNFIVNRGGATAKDLLSLIELVRNRVSEAKGLCLEMEVKVIGEDS